MRSARHVQDRYGNSCDADDEENDTLLNRSHQVSRTGARTRLATGSATTSATANVATAVCGPHADQMPPNARDEANRAALTAVPSAARPVARTWASGNELP